MSSVTSPLTIAALEAANAGFETDSVHAYSSDESSTASTEVGGAEEKHRPYSSSSSDYYSRTESDLNGKGGGSSLSANKLDRFCMSERMQGRNSGSFKTCNHLDLGGLSNDTMKRFVVFF